MKEKNIKELDTPSLVVNIDQLEQNINRIIDFSNEYGVAYRPHVKTHKSADIAHMQIEKGAIGITVATVGEAEVMTAKGIHDILIAYPVASKTKLERVEKLLSEAKVILTVDSNQQASLINDYFEDQNVQLEVWIKVNSGLNRCGVEPGEVVELAKHIQHLSSLSLKGIFTHAGQSYAATSKQEINDIANKEAQTVVMSSEWCEEAGIEIQHRSVGSTPTYQISGKVDGITEIRPGNAVFYDMVQVGLGVASIDDCALTVMTRIGSIKQDRIVIDAGSKTLNLDKGAHGNENISGHGYIVGYPELIIDRLSEEHGVIPITEDMPELNLTDQLQIIPNHACPVVNLFDQYIVHQDGKIVDQWGVHARGKNS